MKIEDLLGRTLGRYKIKRLLGRGGMAAVFVAEDTSLRRDVALKVLYPQYLDDAALVQRFRQEAIVAARLDHQHIVPIFDVGEAEGLPYLAMKLLDGRSLHDELLATDALAPERVTEIISALAAALDYAHDQGVIHRDIKPGNVLITAQGHLALSDFGIAKALDAPGMTGTGVLVGTPDYMAPEQIDPAKGPLDRRADIYALGVMTYRMLTGQRPFQGSTTEVLLAHLSRLPEPASLSNPRLAPAVDAVLERALAKEPAARFDRAGNFATALTSALGEATAVGALTPPPAARGRDAAVVPKAASVLQPATLSPAERQALAAAKRRRKTPTWPIVATMVLLMLVIGGGAYRSAMNFRSANSAGLTQQAGTAQLFGATETAAIEFMTAIASPSAGSAVTPTPRERATETAQASVIETPQAQVSTDTPLAVGGVQPTSAPPLAAPPTATSAPPPPPPPTATSAPPPPPPPTATSAPPPPTATPCAGPLAGGFGAIWRSIPAVAGALGCPSEAEYAGQSSLQYFEGGMMFWWQPTDAIFVLTGDGAGGWERYANPNDPSYDTPREQAPPGRLEPVRGFGTLWHTRPAIRQRLGWGTSPEYPLTGVFQSYPNGLMFYAPPTEGAPARIWTLINDGSWSRYRDPNS